jgi:hypothetical protein
VAVVIRGRRGGVQRESSLATSARARQRHQPDIRPPQQRGDLIDLPLAAEKRRRRNRQVRLVERRQRREVISPELEDALGRAQVFQPVQAEITNTGTGEVGGRLRQQHLTAVAGRCDPRRPMYVEADVTLSALHWLTGVEAHPHLHRTAGQSALCFGGGRDGVGRTRERDEESVALRVDLDSIMLPPRLAQDAVMLGEHIGVSVAELLQQPRRPLDISKEERHRPGRELCWHRSIVSRQRASA